MRRFSAGLRVVTALLVSVLLISIKPTLDLGAGLTMLAYIAWSGAFMWADVHDRPLVSGLAAYWLDVAWASAMMWHFNIGNMMLMLALVHPIVLASIGYGVGHGLMMAALGVVAIAFDPDAGRAPLPTAERLGGFAQYLVLALVPAAALLARPMRALHRRIALIDEIEAGLDPRRGLEPICTELVERLRQGTQSDVLALVLPSRFGAPAMVASREDGGFRASASAHQAMEQLLAQTGTVALSYTARQWWDPRPRLQGDGSQRPSRALLGPMEALARLLDVGHLHIAPLTRYDRQHGHFLIGYRGLRGHRHDLHAVIDATPELLRVIEQAALVDQLQDESASHERARIGRDLHDSAIQPYLGLKYAVECVALRIPADNPARAEVDALADLVNAEVASLRELISGLRTGTQGGDNALVPAVRRQARRFALLFGIEVDVDCPESLPSSRALAGAMFHLVNEALNNIRKHTQARHVRIVLRGDDGDLTLCIGDDSGSVSGRPAPDFHPHSLHERVAELGGTLTIARIAGLDTELQFRIPIHP
ncbi:sensor histidine kinase [Roseateles chitosanitabidus]|jgi:signal transduction histidine kinase|uniref:sensor histidine kinase n=1 Tax=Roseateles chitosanitabidus TaxID=65048 RepID=UPI0008315D85|nr:histidine kinase [Roseateles chitosanitabidus]MBO9686260.1 hypothetical protein [Roseateles chitosanitabidus]